MRTLIVQPGRLVAAVAVSAAVVLAAGAGPAGAGPAPAPSAAPVTFTARPILSGAQLSHTFTTGGSTRTEPLTNPDDITRIGQDLFVGFQNGVGPQGQASTTGNTDSTVVRFTEQGRAVDQWDIRGKCDGLTAVPAFGALIATVNEDVNSSLYTIVPSFPAPFQVRHFTYDRPLPHDGGTDAISVTRAGLVVSASAPGTTGAPAPQPDYPAVYSVSLDWFRGTADVTGLFSDEARARVANVNSPQHGQTVTLGLTDPDSNEVVPGSGPRFAGDFLLTSQGDQQQIYARDLGAPNQRLSVLSLSQSVDDTAWVTNGAGTLYSTDSTHDSVDAVSGSYRPGQVLVAVTPCGANAAPATCPGSPANYLGTLDVRTGQIAPVAVSGAYVPEGGLAFVSDGGDG